jgi:hypothetical protein
MSQCCVCVLASLASSSLACPAQPSPSAARRGQLVHAIKLDGFRILARRNGVGVRVLSRGGHNLLLTSVATLLMATSAPHARPELSKTESWKLTLGTWCVADHPSDDGAYVGIPRHECGENEATLIIGENGYTWERDEGLSCRYSSGRARFDNINQNSWRVGFPYYCELYKETCRGCD